MQESYEDQPASRTGGRAAEQPEEQAAGPLPLGAHLRSPRLRAAMLVQQEALR